MNALDRIRAVLQHQKPNRVPFVPDEDLLSRGEFTRELRNRGMGMCTAWSPTYWSGWPNVSFQTKTEGAVTLTTWETPVGRVSSRRRTHLSRRANAGRSIVEEGWIRDLQDYGPVTFVIEDELFYEDYVQYDYLTFDLGHDCLIKVAGPCTPYETSRSYYGEDSSQGLDRWRSARPFTLRPQWWRSGSAGPWLARSCSTPG